MNRLPLSIPELALIAGTARLLGAGVGLLAADRLSDDQRLAVGWTLVGIGVITTIPIAVQLFNSKNEGRIGDVRTRSPAGGSFAQQDRGPSAPPGLSRCSLWLCARRSAAGQLSRPVRGVGMLNAHGTARTTWKGEQALFGPIVSPGGPAAGRAPDQEPACTPAGSITNPARSIASAEALGSQA